MKRGFLNCFTLLLNDCVVGQTYYPTFDHSITIFPPKLCLFLPYSKKGGKALGFLCSTNFKSSESSLSSLMGVVFIPPFLARGHPDKLKIESMQLMIRGARNSEQ